MGLGHAGKIPGPRFASKPKENRLLREGKNFLTPTSFTRGRHPTPPSVLRAQKVNLCVLFFLPEGYFLGEP